MAARSPIWLQGVAVALAACLALAAMAAFVPVTRGTWVCTLCAAREERAHAFGMAVWREAVGGLDSGWFLGRLPSPHAHDWRRAGCATTSRLFPGGDGEIGCTEFDEEHSLLALLPRYRDQDLATRTLARIAAMTPEMRYGVLCVSGTLADVPQLLRVDGAPPSEDALATGREYYAAWRSVAPDLSDLYPSELP